MKIFKTLKLINRHLVIPAFMLCLLFWNSHAQEIAVGGGKISFSKTEMLLTDAFAEIERQTGYTFAYNETSIARDLTVRTDISGKGITETLDYIFSQTNLQWKIEKLKIMVSPAAKAATRLPHREKMRNDSTAARPTASTRLSILARTMRKSVVIKRRQTRSRIRKS